MCGREGVRAGSTVCSAKCESFGFYLFSDRKGWFDCNDKGLRLKFTYCTILSEKYRT